MTDTSVTSPVERIARVIAAEMLSPNAEGAEELGRPVSTIVDSIWRQETDRAVAVLRTLREPTPEMVEAGLAAGSDPAAIWSAMVRAAIDEHVAAIAP
jgi:hypothetical protein